MRPQSGRSVWLSERTAPMATAAECIRCATVAGHVAQQIILPETREELRGVGYSDEEIDAMHQRMLAEAGVQQGRG